MIFDVDVKGGLNIKKIYGDQALSIFVMPPSMEELRNRLEKRGTETPEAIEKRLAKAKYEMSFAPYFDVVILNDDFERARQEAYETIKKFLEK